MTYDAQKQDNVRDDAGSQTQDDINDDAWLQTQDYVSDDDTRLRQCKCEDLTHVMWKIQADLIPVIYG